MARRSTACSRRKSSIDAAPGEASKPSNTPPSNGSTGSTTAACWNPSETSRQPKPKQTSTPLWKDQTWPHNLNQTASGKPGAVHTKGPVSDIVSAFKTASSSLADKSVAFMVIRNLALYINNECSDPETGFRLIDGLLSYGASRPTDEIREMLEEDRAILHRNWKMNELENSNGDLAAMLQAVDEMLRYARGSERDDLYQLKSNLERKRAGKKLKWGVYAAIAAVVGFLLISEEMNKPPSRVTYQPTYQPSTQRVTTPSVTPNPAITAEVEIKPPTGQGLALNRNQVRYCVFQGERLEAIRPLTSTNFQIDKFNVLIDDYNARCANFRYSAGVLTAIEREASSKAQEFQADARRIVASW
jgi:hypothetical protein